MPVAAAAELRAPLLCTRAPSFARRTRELILARRAPGIRRPDGVGRAGRRAREIAMRRLAGGVESGEGGPWRAAAHAESPISPGQACRARVAAKRKRKPRRLHAPRSSLPVPRARRGQAPSGIGRSVRRGKVPGKGGGALQDPPRPSCSCWRAGGVPAPVPAAVSGSTAHCSGFARRWSARRASSGAAPDPRRANSNAINGCSAVATRSAAGSCHMCNCGRQRVVLGRRVGVSIGLVNVGWAPVGFSRARAGCAAVHAARLRFWASPHRHEAARRVIRGRLDDVRRAGNGPVHTSSSVIDVAREPVWLALLRSCRRERLARAGSGEAVASSCCADLGRTIARIPARRSPLSASGRAPRVRIYALPEPCGEQGVCTSNG